jgi:hypothetical protein
MQIRNQTITGWAVGLAILAGGAGLIFGVDTGQISGFLVMPDFLRRFGNCEDPNNPTVDSCKIPVWREGTIIALLSVGTLFGALLGAPMADYFGRVGQGTSVATLIHPLTAKGHESRVSGVYSRRDRPNHHDGKLAANRGRPLDLGHRSRRSIRRSTTVSSRNGA